MIKQNFIRQPYIFFISTLFVALFSFPIISNEIIPQGAKYLLVIFFTIIMIVDIMTAISDKRYKNKLIRQTIVFAFILAVALTIILILR